MFFVLRTVQLLRGLANGMGVQNFSAATQWCLSNFLLVALLNFHLSSTAAMPVYGHALAVIACRRPFAEAALRAAGELEPEAPPGTRWLPFGPGFGTQWPPTTAEA